MFVQLKEKNLGRSYKSHINIMEALNTNDPGESHPEDKYPSPPCPAIAG